MITLKDLLESKLITYSGYVQLCYEDSDGKHRFLSKIEDLKYDERLAKFQSYFVSNINLDTFEITLV